MPVLTSCAARSPPAAESPPRKKFKFSLKLKTKKKAKAKNLIDSDSGEESDKEIDASWVNFERNDAENSSLTMSTNRLSDVNNTLAVQADTVTPPLPYSGLANLGNTCYLNAVLQVLRYCPGFLKSLVNLDEISADYCPIMTSKSDDQSDVDLSKKPSVIHNICKLINLMENAEENYKRFGLEASEVKTRSGWTTLAVHPKDFVKDFSGLCPLFSGCQQHDAQEFLRSFLSLVEEECVGLVEGENTQENTKGNIGIASNESKVRGGCKYFSTITSSVAMATKSEPTRTMCTEESSRTQPNSNVDCDTVASPDDCTAVPKSVQKSKPTCSETVNVVKQLFEGTLMLQTCCLSCEGLRQRYENFQDISVPVQNTKSENRCGNNLSDSEDESDQDLNLSWAISKFASIERLYGDNKYFCEKCATLTEADISTYFEKLPQVLTIHLKRFQTSYGSQSLFTTNWVTKVTKSLHTPQQLSLKKWCSKTCSEKNAMYQLFGVVMHSGMSSCSGHYLSYVNVDILKRQADEGMVNNNSGSCTAVRYETVRNSEDEMQVDDDCTKVVHNTESPSFVENRQDRSVKCGSSQISATQANDVNNAANDDEVMYKEGATKSHIIKEDDYKSIVCKKDVNSSCDEEIECCTNSFMETRDVGCEKNNIIDESEDLCCDESLDVDLDEEDTCDYSELIETTARQLVSMLEDNATDTDDTEKSNEQPHRRISLRKRSAHSVKKDDDFDSSSDEEDEAPIPRSMDITRYFKPIPKSENSTKNFCRNSDAQSCPRVTSRVKLNKELLNGNDEIESCSQTEDTATNVLKPNGATQESGRSAFSVVEKRTASTVTKSSGELLNQENNDQGHSCTQTKNTFKNEQESKSTLQTGQCSSFESHQSSTNEVQNGHFLGEDEQSCAQTKDSAEHRNGGGIDAEIHSPCTNPITNYVVHSKTNDFTVVSDGKLFSCEDTCNSKDDDSNILTSTWLKFDDAEVQEISAKDMDEILSPSTSCYSTPYLLFYYRC